MHDLLAGRAWFHGLLHDTVVWRGHPLRIGPGTRLILNEASVEEDDLMNPAGGTRSVAY